MCSPPVVTAKDTFQVPTLGKCWSLTVFILSLSLPPTSTFHPKDMLSERLNYFKINETLHVQTILQRGERGQELQI